MRDYQIFPTGLPEPSRDAPLTWDMFFAEYDLFRTPIVYHEYARVVAATVSMAIREDGRLTLQLEGARTAEKAKGEMILRPFVLEHIPEIYLLEPATELQDLGNGTFQFRVLGNLDFTFYGFLHPKHRTDAIEA